MNIIALYVDDITIASEDLDEIAAIKSMLRQHYEISDLGDITWILERFDKSTVRPISTPSIANDHLVKLSAPEADVKYFQSAVGALMYPSLCTRPDLAYIVAALGRHTAKLNPLSLNRHPRLKPIPPNSQLSPFLPNGHP